MEYEYCSPEEQRFADTAVNAFALVEAVEGPESAARFVFDLVLRSDEIAAETADETFLFENGIDSSSL